MTSQTKAWWIPAGSFLIAVLMSMGSHSSIRALTARLQSNPTPSPCNIISLQFIPVLEKVKVTRITSVSGTAEAPVVISDEVEQVLVQNHAGGKRIFVGRKDLDDDRDHDIIVVLATVTNAKVGTIVTFEGFDVDDPSAGDVPAGGLRTEVENRLAKIKTKDHPTLLEFSLSHDDRPVVDWEDFPFDNRGDITKQSGGHSEGKKRGGCEFLSWDQAMLTDAEKKALLDKKLTDIHFKGMWNVKHRSHDNDVAAMIHNRAKVPVNVIDADGNARVAVFFRVSQQPGDNYKVLAICDQPEAEYNLHDDNGIQFGKVKYKGDKILDKSVPVQDDAGASRVVMREKAKVLGAPGPSRKFRIIYDEHPADKVKITEMLTVWRRLHVELDYMESTATSTSKHKQDVPFAVIQNKDTPDEDYPIPVPGGGANDETTPLITPDLGGMQRANLYPSAFVEVVDDIGPAWNSAVLRVFLHNVSGNLLGAKDFDAAAQKTRDLDTKKKRNLDYWVVHVVAGYEHDGQKSNDPDSHEGGNTLGGLASGLHELDLLSAMVFHETIRDLVKMGGQLRIEGATGNLGNKTAKQIRQDTYAHEATHQFDFPKHGDGGVMSVDGVYFTANTGFGDFTKAKIRSANSP